jgi:DNA gyrase subunit A
MTKIGQKSDLLLVTENGFGKRVEFKNFSPHGRGTGGQIYIKGTNRTGRVAGIMSIAKSDAFVVITNRGMIIKLKAKSVSKLGRTAGGVRLVNIKDPDSVAAVSRIVQD